MKLLFTYYAVVFGGIVLLDCVAIIKFWRKNRIMRRQMRRAERQHLSALPIPICGPAARPGADALNRISNSRIRNRRGG